MARGKSQAAKTKVPVVPKKVHLRHYFCLVDNRHHGARTKIGIDHRRYAKEEK